MTGQLSLFKGKRQRGVALPPPKEFALHCMVADLLRRWIMPGWEWTHLPFGELRDATTAARLARMGVRRGYPDFALFHADGRVCFLEVKRRGGRLSADQARIADYMKRAGHQFEVVDSVEMAINVLVAWGAVRAMHIM